MAEKRYMLNVKIDNRWVPIPAIKGQKGDKGERGETGQRGERGETGQRGEKGERGQQGLQGLQGVQGVQGERGLNGKSAYEVARDNGFTGSLTEWLQSLKGQKGDRGEQGQRGDRGQKGDQGVQGRQGVQGVAGANGKSAYEIALETGFVGSKEQWIASLKGQKGDDTGYNKAYVDSQYNNLNASLTTVSNKLNNLFSEPYWETFPIGWGQELKACKIGRFIFWFTVYVGNRGSGIIGEKIPEAFRPIFETPLLIHQVNYNRVDGDGVFKFYPNGTIFYAGATGNSEYHGSGVYIAKTSNL